MEFASYANAIVLIAFGAAVALALIAASLRNVGPDERLVVYRFGQADQNVRGPGTTFLIPFVDRGIRVSLAPQHVELDGVPATSADGHGVSVDVDLRFLVSRPLAYVIEIPAPFPAGLRMLARSALAHAVTDQTLGDVLSGAVLQDEMVPILEQRLAMAGTSDLRIRVTRVRAASTTDADELATLVELGAAWLLPDPDAGGSRTLVGDVAWAVRKVGRMSRWGIILIAFVAIGVQVVGFGGLQPWTPLSLVTGMFFGALIVPLAELRGEAGKVFRVAGARRMVLWVVILGAWATAALGFVLALALAFVDDFAAGL